MGLKACLRGTLFGSLSGFTLFGAVGAATNAFSGLVGSSIFDAAFENFNVTEIAEISATGGAVVNGAAGLLIGGYVGGALGKGCLSIFSKVNPTVGISAGAITYTLVHLLGSGIGYALFLNLATSNVTLAEVLSSNALGALLTSLPVGCTIGLLVCVGVVSGNCLAALCGKDERQLNTLTL